MPKTKPGGGFGASGTDWSDTGTFVRKPTSGWLHKDHELTNGSYVRYKLGYLGCVGITESMRALQYQARTLVTREAITRLGEYFEKIPVNKKRKVPRQISRLLGEIDVRSASEVYLSIDTEEVLITRAASGKEVVSHSLTSISFASGGEGVTIDFLGYVAKDPVHNRACHVFHCTENIAQLVLASIGQAFELRYKMYLQSSQGVATTPSIDHSPSGSVPQRSLPPLPSSHPDKNNMDENFGIFGEPSPPKSITRDQLPSKPPPITEVKMRGGGSSTKSKLMTQPKISTGLYADLPGFPEPEGSHDQTSGQTNRVSYNPYNTMPADQFLPENDYNFISDEAMYDVAEGVEDKYGHVQQTIHALPSPLPPPPSINDYDEVTDEMLLPPPPPPPENDYQLITIHQKPSIDLKEDLIDITPLPEDEPIYNNDGPIYNNDGPIYNNDDFSRSPNLADYDDPVELKILPIPPTQSNDYDDVSDIIHQVHNNHLQDNIDEDEVDGPLPPPLYHSQVKHKDVPSFDDTIYASPKAPDSATPLPQIDPFAPLSLQSYFHGCISRSDAESLIKVDGDFLVRESTNKIGQFVLTGLANDRHQHLLLIDKSGKVKSKDREFESVPHLVKFFYDRATPLTIGNCEVYLSTPIEQT